MKLIIHNNTNNTGNRPNGRPLQDENDILYLQYFSRPTDYHFENSEFIFFVDTNLCKEKESEIFQKLNTLQEKSADNLSDIFHGNYFAVIIDKKNAKIQISRDVCGVKTGYYTLENNKLIISTVMHEAAEEKQELSYNDKAVGQILYSNYLLDGYTVWQDVEEVKAGATLQFNSGFELTAEGFDRIKMAEQDNDLSLQDNYATLRRETENAHRPYLSKNNTIFLSGGLDSVAMLATMDDIAETGAFDSVSFRVKDTDQDETVYAADIAAHLRVKNTIKEIDPDNIPNITQFEARMLQMNNPYFGSWIFGNFTGGLNHMYYAGQDSRLHTPALNEVDKWAFSLLPYQNSFLLRYVAKPLAGFARKLMNGLGWDKGATMIQRNLYKATYLFDLKEYVTRIYLKIGEEKIRKKGFPTDWYADYAAHFEFDLSKIKTPRALYNKLVELKWKEQYIYDMRYLQDMARMNGTYIALPFYNKKLAEFSSSIPFGWATKATLGRGRFGSARRIIYKYVLRNAYRDKLNDTSFYRAKAVSQTLHQLFNGDLGTHVRFMLTCDLREEDSFIRRYRLDKVVDKFMRVEEFTTEHDDLMASIHYIAALTVWHKHIFLAKKQQKSIPVNTSPQEDKSFSAA